MKKIVSVLIASSFLSACATMSPKECQSADWREVGYSDASKGKPVQLSGHREACAEVKITPDTTRYMSGYNAGARLFCTYDNGLKFGKKGRSARNLCTTAALGKDFFKGYNKGKRIYDIDQKISKKETEIDKIERKLTKIRKSKTKSSVREVDLLYREKELVSREIRALKDDRMRIR